MTLQEIRDLLDAEILAGGSQMHTEVISAFGADMMSDLLAYWERGKPSAHPNDESAGDQNFRYSRHRGNHHGQGKDPSAGGHSTGGRTECSDTGNPVSSIRGGGSFVCKGFEGEHREGG